MAVKLTWRGKEVTEQVKKNLMAAMGEFALEVQAGAMKQLEHGHGVETGTLRRSLHVAQPGYNWDADNVTPSPQSPNRNGMKFDAMVNGKKISIEVGSGLRYALAVHQGHHTFAGYHFLTIGVDQAKKKLPGILEKHRLK